MDFRDYIRVLRRGWPIVIALTVLGLAAAFGYLAVAAKTYVSSSVVLVSTQGSTNLTELQQGNTFSQQAVGTYAQVAQSPSVLAPVIERLGLDMTPAELGSDLDVTVTPDTSLFQIKASAADPELAAQIANAVTDSAIEYITGLESAGSTTPLVLLEQVQTGSVPTSAESPSPRIVVALGLILGVALGLAVTLVAATLNTRIQNVAEITSLTDRPILARIPQHRRAKRTPLIVREHPEGLAGEAFRTLRTNLRFLENSASRSFLVTSPSTNEGKSSVAANLAWSLAEADFSVVLVDADLRNPKVGSFLSLTDGPGLTDVISGDASLETAIRPTVHGLLHAVLAGSSRPNPSELLGSSTMREIVASLEQRFDYVIIDAPAVLSFTDAAVLSSLTSGTIITIAAERTGRDQLGAALATLANVGITPVGIVVNRVRVGDSALGATLAASGANRVRQVTAADGSTTRRVSRQPGGDPRV